MSFQHVDFENAMRRLADRRIEDAMRDGKFNNLRGSGKPLDLEPIPATENARLAWWALRILKQNSFTPDEVKWRKQIDLFREEILSATTERRVRALVAAHNQLVHQINTLGTNALNAPVAPLAVDDELNNLRLRTASAAVATTAKRPCQNVICQCSTNPMIARYCKRCGNELALAS